MPNAIRVLVIDDDSTIRIVLKEMLLRDGYEVIDAASGAEGLQAMALRSFELALIDLQLNDMSGLDVLAEMRQHSPETVVIILTGHATLESAVDALRRGAHDYLFKPFKTVEIRESLRAGLLKRQQELDQRQRLIDFGRTLSGETAEVLQAQTAELLNSEPTKAEAAQMQARFLRRGALVIDFMRHVVTLDGHLMELSPTEFDLLAYLATAHPRVVPQVELAREVQGYQHNTLEADEALRYHIYRLRRKIKDVTGRPDVLRTVRGVGYTLDEIETA